jgi:quinol monooxygenase YgiN
MAFAAAVTWYARPGNEPRLEGILAELATITRAEPGCLMYQPHRSADTEGGYFIYERFVDEAAFNAHIESEPYRRLVLNEAVMLLDRRERSLYFTIDDKATGGA